MYDDILARLAASDFRRRFVLKDQDFIYIEQKGLDVIAHHAADFIAKRIAPAFPPNDGHQTPMRGHPVFVAQHATACCCRGCIAKWHKLKSGVELTSIQQQYLIGLIMEWIKRQMKHGNQNQCYADAG